MNAVNRGRLQTDDDRIKVFVVLHAFSNQTGKLVGTRLVIAK